MKADDRIKELYKRAKREELVVLVWGPGDPRGKGSKEHQKYWEKRKKIRAFVAREFPEAEVLFSESGALRDHTRPLETLLAEELVHAAVADCILVLDTSRGAHVEVDRFSANPVVANKLRVLLPNKYVGSKSLVSEIFKGLRVTGFSDDEFEKCTLASVKAVEIVRTIAIEKYMTSTWRW